MLYFIYIFIALGIVAAIIAYFGSQRKKNQQEKTTIESEVAKASDCCGQHEVCERDSLLAAVSKKIDYYDDEELDAYQGLSSDEYDEKAIENFREVLYTMLETDVAGWLRSLQLRNINLPDPVKDEAFLFLK
jgi:hypothetical protein